MNKQLIAGIMILTTSLSMSVQAAPTNKGGKSFKEALAEHVKTLKEYYTKGTTGANLTAAQKAQTQDILLGKLSLSAGDRSTLKGLMNNGKDQAAVAASLGTILAVKEVTAGKTDPQAKAAIEASDAFLKLLSSRDLIGDKKTSTFLSKEELAAVSDSMLSLSTKPDTVLTTESGIKSYSKILSKIQELSAKSETYEEAAVKAVMEVQGVSKEEAIKLIKKFKDCV